jgi:hypothetical protein
MYKRLFYPLILIVILTACQSTATVQPQNTSIPATNTPLPPTQVVPTPVPATNTPSAPTQEPTPTHIRVDLTPAQLAVFSKLTQDKGIPTDQIQLISTEAVQWDSGCLGIVIPGVMCTKGPVDGFKIILSANGTTYEYHTNQDGSSILLATSPFVHIAVRLPDNSVKIVSIDILSGRNTSPTDQGFNPYGGAVGGTVYALSLSPAQAVAVDASGSHALDFITNPNYGLAVWPGDANHAPRLAWGTSLDNNNLQTSLVISALDGSQIETLVTETVAAGAPLYQLVAQHWSADGNALYYSKEPFGIGGYILYGGASSLYRIDIASKQITTIIPLDFQKGRFVCLDAFSADYSQVADHCTAGVITVRSLDTGHSVTIQPPMEVKDFGPMGSARFSPDGSRLAFALSVGNPDAEQSWLALSNGLGGDSKLLLTGKPGQSFAVLGWLDDNTLLVQSNSIQCNPDCTSVWTVSVDGLGLNKVSEGNFVTFVDGYKP